MCQRLRQFFDMMQTVRLLDDLGERYGSTHEYHDLRTPADAIKLLCINKPELKQELIKAHEHGIGYRLIQAGEDLDTDDLHLPIGSNDLILVPVVVGSGGSAIGKIIVGVVLVALSFVTFGASAAFAGLGAAGAFGSTALAGIGASLILGGVADLISPQPVLPKPGNNRFADSTNTDGPQSIIRGADGKQSYAYTGAANTVGVGAVIPVAYGEVLIGSNLMSASVDVTDESDPLKTTIQQPGTDTVRFGGEKLSYSTTLASGIEAKRLRAGEGFPKGKSTGVGEFIALRKGADKNCGEIRYDKKNRQDPAFILELRTGLFDFVSGSDSTVIDGFISYRLTTETRISGPDPTTGSSTATIQGLLLRGQTYRWLHAFQNTQIKGEEDVKFKIEILDFSCAYGCSLYIERAGFQD